MKKLKVLALALICAAFSPVKADEGMWLLQLMKEQNLADRMKAQGLKMDIADIYNPNTKCAAAMAASGPLCCPATCTGRITSTASTSRMAACMRSWTPTPAAPGPTAPAAWWWT